MSNFPTQPKCSVISCKAPQCAKQLCEKHYKRLKRHGTTSDEVGKKIINEENISKHPLYNTWRSITRLNKGLLICDEWKKFENFIKDAGEKPQDAYALKRIDTLKKYAKDNVRWALKNRDLTSRQSNAHNQKTYRTHNPEYFKNKELQKKYGITLEDYTQMLTTQNKVCAICKKEETNKNKGITFALSVDHCHETNEIRGLLCSACNTAIGLLKHDEKLLKSAINYLLKTGNV